jgi:phytoene dehydrogenase-like protein
LQKKAIIIGSGFAGLSAASFMAKSGWKVTVLEKHDIPGGRARKLEVSGFTFDRGPSWYWMPDVFERYFHLFGKKDLTLLIVFIGPKDIGTFLPAQSNYKNFLSPSSLVPENN